MQGRGINFLYEICVFCTTGYQENFFTPWIFIFPFFLMLENLPQSIVLASLTRKEWFWFVECSRIAGYLLGISPYNSFVSFVSYSYVSFVWPFFSVVLVLHSTVHLLARLWPSYAPWVVVFCQPPAHTLLEICSLIFPSYPCRAPRPTDSFKSVYLLLPTSSNKENDLSSIILIPDL